MKGPPRPTVSELAILRALWQRGPATVRQVLDELGPDVGYTTALKLMQIMFDKGLLLRDERRKSHVYRAAIPEDQTLRGIISDLLDRAFGGSAQKLLMAALSARRATPAQLAEMRRLIDEAEKNIEAK